MQNLWPIASTESYPSENNPISQPWVISHEEAPFIQFLDKLLTNAVEQGVSDLHFEPYEDCYRVRIRQDGILHEALKLPLKLAPRIVARLKVLSQLDISECRRPQDGRFKFTLPNQTVIDFRISCCPMLFGEKIVLRLQDPRSNDFKMDSLGLECFQKELLIKTLFKPQGMILVTGPTGSGKTISLYTAIHLLNTIDRNISSCEDPIEIYLPGINQVNVNLKTGLTFAAALRTFLRQDPDVIMVGEIRDLDTAEMAVKAAQTGHLVLSTLHTNSASESITRLSNMGTPHYLLASCLSLVIAQRLVRRLCESCKQPRVFTQSTLLEMGFSLNETADNVDNDEFILFTAIGCDKCKQGYSGRIGIYELMPITPELQSLILLKRDASVLHQQASQEGMWDLKKAAFQKAMQGITSLDEIHRVIT